MDDFTAAEYIQETEPDIVIVMLSTNTAGAYPEYSDYGVQALTK